MKSKATRTKIAIARGRSLTLVLWTLAAIGVGVLYNVSLPPAAPETHSHYLDFSGLDGLIYVLLFFGWLIGLLVVCLLAGLANWLAEAILYRRECAGAPNGPNQGFDVA